MQRLALPLCLASLLLSCTPTSRPAIHHAPPPSSGPAPTKAVVTGASKTTLLSDLRLRPIVVDRKNASRRRFGALTLVAAYELETHAPHFGGLSSLSVAPATGRMTFLSDRAHWFSAVLHQDSKTGKLVGLSAWRSGPVIGTEAKPLVGKEGDSEGIEAHGGALYLSLEQRHRILRYDAGLTKTPTRVWTPAALAKAPSNGGLEAITVLPDGRLVLLCEEYRDPRGDLRGWIVTPDKKRAEPFSLIPSDGFRPTDLATLPNGDVLLLERAFSILRGIRGRLRYIPAEAFKTGARLAPKEILRLDSHLVVDNFEGLAVQRHAGSGRLLIYLVSDDNFSRLQRTLLYQFAFDPPVKAHGAL